MLVAQVAAAQEGLTGDPHGYLAEGCQAAAAPAVR